MIYYDHGRWQTITVIFILLMGAIFATPNFLPERVRGALPGWVPSSQINLGLDLQGGSYLLLEVDMPGVVKERLETIRGDIRAALRKPARILFDGLDPARESVSVHITNPSQIEAARKILQDIASPPGTFLGLGSAQYDMTDDGMGNFTLRLSPAYQRQLQAQIVNQSIEVVRRRIDALGTREPTIQQQGEDRILVQVPGLKNPEELKRVLSTTAKMTFRMVDMTGNVQDALKGRVPPDDELLYQTDKAGNNTVPYLIQRRVMVSGDRLEAGRFRLRSAWRRAGGEFPLRHRAAHANSAMSPRSMSASSSPSCSTIRCSQRRTFRSLSSAVPARSPAISPRKRPTIFPSCSMPVRFRPPFP